MRANSMINKLAVALLAASSCAFAADAGFLRRQLQDVAPKPDDLTAAGSRRASYKPLFGAGDADAEQLKSIARYGEITVAPDGMTSIVSYPAEEQMYFVEQGSGTLLYADEKAPIKANDFMYLPAAVKHGIANTSNAPVKVIVLGYRIPAAAQVKPTPKLMLANADEVQRQVLGQHGPTTQFKLLMGLTSSQRDRLASAYVMNSLFIMDFAAGGTNIPHNHPAEEEIYLLLRGGGDMVAGRDAEGKDVRYPVKQGAAFLFKPGTQVGYYSNAKEGQLPDLILAARSRAPGMGRGGAAPKFFLGADVSSLASRFGGGRGGPVVYRENGSESTEYAIMMKHGWNAYRLRVFVSPVRSAPNNSLENTLPIAKQIKEAGGTFMLDIHYSDTWADPQHQETPAAWRDLDAAGLEKRVEEYSKEVITAFKNAGAMPEMVQVGNEITGGMLWPTGYVKVPPSEVKLDAGNIRGPFPEPYVEARQWENLTRLIKAGVRGVRAGAGSSPVQIIMHIDCGGDWPITQWWFDHLREAGVSYDIIGQSFYPRWHGTLAQLQQNIIEAAHRYGKPVMVVETGYPQTGGDQVPAGNKYSLWPGTPAGQLQFMVDLVNTVKRAGGTGVFYWAPEGSRGNGMWNADGTPAPSIFVLDNLTRLTGNSESRLPPATAR